MSGEPSSGSRWRQRIVAGTGTVMFRPRRYDSTGVPAAGVAFAHSLSARATFNAAGTGATSTSVAMPAVAAIPATSPQAAQEIAMPWFATFIASVDLP